MGNGNRLIVGLVLAVVVLGALVLVGVVALAWFFLDAKPVEVVSPGLGGDTAAPAMVASAPLADGESVEAGEAEAGGGDGEAVGSDGGGGGALEFEDLMGKVLAGEASDDEQLAFWEQMRKTDRIDGVIGMLREQVEADVSDVTGRMTLAQLYVMKLMAAPMGPERGLLAGKAESLWAEVLAQDPDHFEAQRSMAFSLSQYPDFMGKTGEAIEAYERAIAIEGRAGASDETAAAYVELARLHQKSGDPAAAYEVLQRGVEVHPEHAAMRSQLEKLEEAFVFEEEE